MFLDIQFFSAWCLLEFMACDDRVFEYALVFYRKMPVLFEFVAAEDSVMVYKLALF